MDIPIMILVLVFSLVVHESAHALMALRLGDDTALRLGRISLNPLVHLDPVGSVLVPLLLALLPGGLIFGWAKPVPVNPNRLGNPTRDHAVVAAAGPGSNLLLALVAAVLLGLVSAWAHSFGGGAGVQFLGRLLEYGITINIVLALFNLIPLPPLDGSWIMLAGLRGEAAAAYERLRPYGFLIIIVLLNVGLGAWLGTATRVVGQIYYRIVFQVGSLLS